MGEISKPGWLDDPAERIDAIWLLISMAIGRRTIATLAALIRQHEPIPVDRATEAVN
jgi:hypothetical protein